MAAHDGRSFVCKKEVNRCVHEIAGLSYVVRRSRSLSEAKGGDELPRPRKKLQYYYSILGIIIVRQRLSPTSRNNPA